MFVGAHTMVTSNKRAERVKNAIRKMLQIICQQLSSLIFCSKARSLLSQWSVTQVCFSSDEHSSLLRYGINYDCKKFYIIGPRPT
jgi:hypothetical protein